MKPSTMNEIIQAVQWARKKHPHFADNRFHAVSLASEELGEFSKAVNEENWEQSCKEALHTIAVLVRFLEE